MLCGGLAGCEPRTSLEDARAEAASAEAFLERAVALQKDGKSQEADAEAARARNAFAAARDRYLSARADLSDDPGVLTEFAALCEKLRDHDLAGEAYLRAAAARPDDAALWFRAGRCLVDAGGRYLARSAEPLDRAEQLARSSPGAVSLADIESARGDVSWKNAAYDIAGKRYAAALATDPQNTRGLIGAVAVGVALGAPTQAESALAQLQGTGQTLDAGALDARLREAYLIYRRTRPELPEEAAAYRALAGIAVRVGFLEDARVAIERALNLNADDVFSLNMAGSLAQRAGDVERARQAYTRSLQLQPDQPRTREALAALPPAANGAPQP